MVSFFWPNRGPNFWFVCWTIAFFVLFECSYSSNITVQPVSINATLNCTVTFTCEAIADAVSFLVNREAATDGDVISKGFAVTTDNDGGYRTAELQATAYSYNNNTNITCRATTYTPLTAVLSNTAVLLIQGPLASVGNLNYTYITGSSVLLTWTAPYTLDNVPITGYHVDDGINNITTNNTNATLSTTDPDPCILTIITISPINGAGIGEPNNISFYYQKVPTITPNVLVIPTINGQQQISINININVSELCIGEYPNNITVIILDINNVVQDTPSVPTQVNDELIISGTVSVSNNLNTFIINVTMSNNDEEFLPTPSFVFGFLGPVTNIRSEIDNCTNISIYWDGPTLDDDRVSILYYNLSIYDNITGSLVDTVIVNGTSYQFKDTDLFIHRYTYVITGVNELGEGTSNNKTFSYQRVPRSAESTTVLFGNYTNNYVTVSFDIPVILECTGEAPENATVTIQCNGTGEVYSNTHLVEYAHRPMNIMGSVSVPRYEQCSLKIVFSNANGSSEPFIKPLNVRPPFYSSSIQSTMSTLILSPTSSPVSTSFPIFAIAGIVVAGIAILIVVVAVSLTIVLCNRKKHSDNSNLLDEQVVFDGSNVRTSVDSTKGLLDFKSSTAEQPTTPTTPTGATSVTSPTSPTSPTGATGATKAAKEPIYSDLGQVPKVGVAKPVQSEATVQYADINIIVPKQRVTQSYDDVVVGAGTTVIGGGPAVPPPVPAKGGESDPPPVPKETKGATTTQMETENNDDAARNLPHHIEDENFSSPPPPPLPPPYNAPVTEGRREGGEEGGGPNAGATTEIHGTGLVSYL